MKHASSFARKKRPHLPAWIVIVLILLFAPWGFGQAVSQPPATPKAALEQFLDTIRSMEFPPQDIARHDTLVKEADSFLDLEAMTRTALGPHWDEATENDRQTFLALMWDLIAEIAYPGSREFFSDFEITFPRVYEIDNGFEVRSLVKQREELREAEVIYDLYQKEGRWQIFDIALDGVSIIEDLSYQFNKIIQESSFSGLLDRMRERIEQAKQENAPKSA